MCNFNFTFESIRMVGDNADLVTVPSVARLTFTLKNGICYEYFKLQLEPISDTTMRVSGSYPVKLLDILEVDDGDGKKELFRIDANGDAVSLGPADDEAVSDQVYKYLLYKNSRVWAYAEEQQIAHIEILNQQIAALEQQVKDLEAKSNEGGTNVQF